MIIVIFLVCAAIIVFGCWLYNELNEVAGGITMFCGIAGSIVSFITLVGLLINVSGLKAIEPKIQMYQTENANIETQIADCVKQYQQYETEIFTEVTPDSAITLVALYPELKSDTLVKKQIEVYVDNNKKIKELKEQKIMGDVTRWWLYFGGEEDDGND